MPSRRKRPPPAVAEDVEIRTADGASLRAVVGEPPAGTLLAGTCVLAHAMFARKSEFERPDGDGLAKAYAARGFRTVAFDFRGHGDSSLPAAASAANPAAARDWGYDDLVRFDLPAVVEASRARGEGLPVIVVGHSLGAHVALAAQGAGLLRADAIIAIAGNVWLRELEPSRLRWAAKVATARAMLATVARVGRFPVRRLRIGSDDESATYIRDLMRAVLADTWSSADGALDYLAGLSRVRAPVFAVSSAGDRLMCHPDCAARFARRVAGPVEVRCVERADDGGPPPGHMELVTTRGARSVLLAALDWVASTARPEVPAQARP